MENKTIEKKLYASPEVDMIEGEGGVFNSDDGWTLPY